MSPSSECARFKHSLTSEMNRSLYHLFFSHPLISSRVQPAIKRSLLLTPIGINILCSSRLTITIYPASLVATFIPEFGRARVALRSPTFWDTSADCEHLTGQNSRVGTISDINPSTSWPATPLSSVPKNTDSALPIARRRLFCK